MHTTLITISEIKTTSGQIEEFIIPQGVTAIIAERTVMWSGGGFLGIITIGTHGLGGIGKEPLQDTNCSLKITNNHYVI